MVVVVVVVVVLVAAAAVTTALNIYSNCISIKGNSLSLRNRVLFEKLTAAKKNNILYFTEHKGSLAHQKEPASGSYPEQS
jgi:hypothetical protein